jgi:futalosine hydrolase
MIKLLLVSATEFEVQETLNSAFVYDESLQLFRHNTFSDVYFLITGIGIVAATMKLTLIIERHDVKNVLNIGFCGSFRAEYPLGSIVNVHLEVFPEVGIINDIHDIIPLHTLIKSAAITSIGSEMSVSKIHQNVISSSLYPRVNGLTVQSCTNNQVRADYFVRQFNADVETMEGGACMSVCNQLSVAFLQLRVVSNMIPGREADRWNIPKAKEVVKELLDSLLRKL